MMTKLLLPALLAAGLVTGYFARGAAEPPAKKVNTADLKVPAHPKDGNYLGIKLAHDDPAADLRLIRKKINQVESEVAFSKPYVNQPKDDEPDHAHHMEVLKKKLEDLHRRARVLVKQGNEKELIQAKRQIDAIHREMKKFDDEPHEHGHKHEHEHGEHGHHHHGAGERAEHLHAAAKHLAAAGYHEQAKHIAREAEKLAARHHHDERFQAIMEAIAGLRREVAKLRAEVRGRKAAPMPPGEDIPQPKEDPKDFEDKPVIIRPPVVPDPPVGAPDDKPSDASPFSPR